MQKLHTHTSTKKTKQTQAVLGKKMVPNNAGGYGFEVDKWTRLDRFLILGTEGGTYYVKEAELTKQNTAATLDCLKEDGKRMVQRVVDISDQGRAPKNDPALFCLALASTFGDEATRRLAFAALPKVARIGTHLFHFAEYRQAFGGWGRSMRRAVRNWYDALPVPRLAHQIIKYQGRDGWTHRDLFRLAHPAVAEGDRQALYRYIARGTIEGHLPEIVLAFEAIKSEKKVAAVVKAIEDHGLTREMIPTEMLNEAGVWEALLEDMPITALIRNLGNLSKCGLLKPLSKASHKVVDMLANEESLRKGRVHPIQILAATATYAQGHGVRGKGVWTPVSQVVEALGDSFQMSFKNVEPTGKNIVLAIDISGSMHGQEVSGVPGLNAHIAAACLAMVIARTEENYAVVPFDDVPHTITIHRKDAIDAIVKKIIGAGGGGTNCSAPIEWALKERIEADAFIIFTDNETWSGRGHPFQSVQEYRQKMKYQAKLITCDMMSNDTTVHDVDDPLSMHCAGFDTHVPSLISEFIKDK